MTNRYPVGKTIATVYLIERGYDSVDNGGYTCEEGSADIVCRDPEDGCHVIVSVSAHRKRGAENPKARVNERAMKRVAVNYMLDHPEADSVRCDSVEVTLITGGGASLEHTVGICRRDR